MNHGKTLKQKLSAVDHLRERGDYDAALAEVEGLLKDWPGNGHLHILWARLVQLQDDPKNSLDDVRRALQRAVDLDRSSPAAAIELGHFLDAVEDDPRAASRAYAGGIAAARRLLIEGLIGQAKALLQLDKKEESLRCLLEVMHLMRFEPTAKPGKSRGPAPEIVVGSPTGRVYSIQLKGPFAEEIEEILGEVLSHRSA